MVTKAGIHYLIRLVLLELPDQRQTQTGGQTDSVTHRLSFSKAVGSYLLGTLNILVSEGGDPGDRTTPRAGTASPGLWAGPPSPLPSSPW